MLRLQVQIPDLRDVLADPVHTAEVGRVRAYPRNDEPHPDVLRQLASMRGTATTGFRAGAGTVIRFGAFFVVEVSRAFLSGRPPIGRRIGHWAASVRNALRKSSGRSMCGEWPQPSSTTSVNEPPAAA